MYLPDRDHHGAWVNSRALELAGVTRDTPDPADGRFERDSDGEPTGMLQEGPMEYVGRPTPPVTAAERLAALLSAQRRLHSPGVTARQDALVGALWWNRERGAEQIPELVERRAALSEHPDAYDPRLDAGFTPLREQDLSATGLGQAA